MAWNGSGIFQRLYNWVTDLNSSIPITASRFDAEMDGMATGITACVAKNGENVATANLPMGGFRHTEVGNSSSRTSYPSTAQLQDSSLIYATDTGSANAYAIGMSPSIGAYAAGQRFLFIASNTNTTSSTLNVNGLGTRSILTWYGAALPAGAITSGRVVDVVYNGTAFVLLSGPNSAATDLIVGLTPASNKMIRYTGASTADLIDFRDQDDMDANSASSVASQQSIKAYVDNHIDFFTDTGSADAYVVAKVNGAAPPSYKDGMKVRFFADNASTGAAVTINVNSLGSRSIVLPGGGTPRANDINGYTEVIYDLGNTRFQLVDNKLNIPAYSLATNGYIRLDNDLLIQWGQNTASTGGSVHSFPIAFSSANYMLAGAPENQTVGIRLAKTSTSQLTIYSASGTPAVGWIAIGV